MACWVLACAALSLAACSQAPEEAHPAIWQVSGPHGEHAWLFGTVHAAPAPLQWRTPPVVRSLDQADEILVEVANVADEQAIARTFAGLSRTPGLPPVSDRVAPGQRGALRQALKARNLSPEGVRDVETWAVALTLARAPDSSDPANGVDRGVLADKDGKPVIELEGAAAQLSIFDRLPEADQRTLLRLVLKDAGGLDSDADLLAAWRAGDMARIERETRTGLLADPHLRAALFTGRNRRWTARILSELAHGRRPFVAVGAAHMVGSDGLVAMLRQAGMTVTRVP